MKEDIVNSNAMYMVEIENLYVRRNDMLKHILTFILLQIVSNYKL